MTKYLRKGIIHPHLSPLPSRERVIRTGVLSQAPPVIPGMNKARPMQPGFSFQDPLSVQALPLHHE